MAVDLVREIMSMQHSSITNSCMITWMFSIIRSITTSFVSTICFIQYIIFIYRERY